KFNSDEQIDYPPIKILKSNKDPRKLTPQQRRWILDFVYWYQDASARRVKKYIQIARSAFLKKPCEIKLGHASEMAIKGHSYSSACRILTDTRQLSIRSTHASVGYFHVKRVSTPARFYGFSGFLTEPPGNVKPKKMAARIFTDACVGVTAYFDYMQNPTSADKIYTSNIGLLDGRAAIVDVALFFSEADHYLRIDRSYPQGLLEFANPVRDVADYDVIDERLIADGILDNYAILVIVGDPLIEPSTLQQLSKAVKRKHPLKTIQICQQQPNVLPGQFTCLDDRIRTINLATKKPVVSRVLGEFGGPQAINALQQAYANSLARRGLSKDEIRILTERDGFITGLFEHRILTYNTANDARTIGGNSVKPRHILEIKRSK
ncbi:MAG: hypothetical protein ACYTBZ_06430, partial [Planctomycetota bacterium]